jgi:predicted ester cyclase
LRIEPVIVLAAGDLVAMRWHGSGTHTGAFLSVEPTGAPLEWAGSSIFRFACGRIAEHWVETDLAIRVGSVPDLATPAI